MIIIYNIDISGWDVYTTLELSSHAPVETGIEGSNEKHARSDPANSASPTSEDHQRIGRGGRN
jgi:hypothetical protein